MTLLALAGPPAAAQPSSDRWIHRDDAGVLRFADGTEARLWGVNYLAPFSMEYRNLKRRRVDPRTAIDRDLDDIAAMEANLIRVVVFDRELSDPEGNLLENDHLALLDHLVAACGERGLFVYLIPISWLPSGADSTDGFSDHWFRHELISNHASWPAQERYLRALAGRTNPETGRSYAEDPTIALWGLFADPLVVGDHVLTASIQDAAKYARHMMEVLRDGGVRGPVLYSAYGLRLENPEHALVYRESGVDGWDFELFAGLPDGRINEPNLLDRSSWQLWLLRRPIEWIWGEGRAPVIGAYDVRGNRQSYWLPPLARSFVASGVQVAALFQYDTYFTADRNPMFRVDYMNRVYTPAKAMSFLIAGRLFRRIPLGTPVAETFPPDNWHFDGTRVSAWYDVSLWRDDEAGEVIYSHAPPFALGGTLEDYRFVAGADSSDLVGFEGVRWFTVRHDVADGRLDLDLAPRVNLLGNPFEAGKWAMNVRFCKQVAALDESPAWVDLHLADTTVAVYREVDGAWSRMPGTSPRFDAVPGRYRIYLDESR